MTDVLLPLPEPKLGRSAAEHQRRAELFMKLLERCIPTAMLERIINDPERRFLVREEVGDIVFKNRHDFEMRGPRPRKLNAEDHPLFFTPESEDAKRVENDRYDQLKSWTTRPA